MKFFNFWNIAEKHEGFDASLVRIQSYQEPFPIADSLHLAKNWPSRMIKYRLAVVLPRPVEAKIYSARVQSMVETLGPMLPLTDESQIEEKEKCVPHLNFSI
jgi:hypothetical protein